jgi:hypothetical protein
LHSKSIRIVEVSTLLDIIRESRLRHHTMVMMRSYMLNVRSVQLLIMVQQTFRLYSIISSNYSQWEYRSFNIQIEERRFIITYSWVGVVTGINFENEDEVYSEIERLMVL